MRIQRLDSSFRRIVYIVISASIIATLGPLPVRVAQAADITTIATSYQPTISETIDASGFKHPGVGFTKAMLENMRTQVRDKKEPWNSHFNDMLKVTQASRTPGIANVNGADPSKPRIYGIDSQGANGLFIADATTAYTQAVLYYVTGDDVYRANAMRMIRLYEQMDPSKYVYFTDSHIHTGIPLSRMVGAAEILRYTSTQDPALAWTEDDTLKFSTNLVIPVMQTFDSCNCRFMNQHLYTTIAKMSGSIFIADRAQYDQAVEWFTVNKDAPDPAWTGSIKQLFRLVTRNDATGEEVEPNIQHVEMGRDQAHGAGDLTNTQILARLMMAQGTKVDPVTGTPSTETNAVGPYEFLDDRVLAVHELFGSFMVGYEIPWVPTAMSVYPDGTVRAIYPKVSSSYRGRLSQNTWEAFYYYQYVRGINMEQRAPNFTKIYAKRRGYNWTGTDGGGDFWIAIPKEAEAEGGKYLPVPIVNPYKEVEDRFTAYDNNATAQTEGATSYVNVTATPEGTRLAVLSYGDAATTVGLRFRTNGQATLDVYGKSFALPNTQGQWRYMVLPISVGDFLLLTITGAGTTVAIDHINVQASTLLTAPVFKLGNDDRTEYSYAGTTFATTLDLSATDPGVGEVLSYKMDNLPPGASFNVSTGAFSWAPSQAGTYVLVAEAFDGTTVTTKRITIVVAPDRQAAVGIVSAPYKPDTLYVTATKVAYQSAYADMQNTIGSSTDAAYFQKLAALRTTVSGLRELTPLLKDGSMDYTNMFFASNLVTNFGTDASPAVDFNPESFIGFTLARDSNREFTLDFGPGFKVSANAFQLQPRTSFPERIGGTTIFGSNDNEHWTRLTPDETLAIEDMQTLNVQEDLRNQRYRFLRVYMLHLISSYNILEPGEFRIFGTRYETVNKLTSVTMSSDQALRTRIIPGNTVKVKFVSTEPINNVNVTIQGQSATVTTTDNLNWTASWVANSTAPYGKLSFLLNYKTAAGVDAEPTAFTTDSSWLTLADQTNLINNVTTLTTVTDSYGRNLADAITVANLLFDSNISSATDYRLNGSGNGGWVEFDFRGGGTVDLSKVEILARQDQVARINGTVLQGSNDNTTWDTITNAAGNNADWQTLTVNSATPYRYLRVINGNAWFGNMAELRLYGVVKSTAQIATASITSAQSLSPASILNKRVVAGNSVTLTFAAKAAINNVTAAIQGQAATVTTTDNINFTATATLPQGVAVGKVSFAINYQLQDGSTGYPATATTDGSGAYVVDETDLIRNISTVATLIDSTPNRTAATTVTAVNSLFDGNIGTFSDFRSTNTTNNCIGSYIIFDFKPGNQVNLTSVELMARQDQTARAKFIVFQGSNDNSTWVNITGTAIDTKDWQTFAVTSAVPYRYIRIYNAAAWCGNMAEVRLHGSLHGADTTAPVTQADAPAGPVNKDTTVTLSATDAGSGVQATYYTVDGGAKQTGKSILFNTEGNHALLYWSVDWAGNAEPQHSVSVKIDKTAPVTTATTSPAMPANGWYAGDVTVNLAAAAADAGNATAYYSVDGGAQQTGNTVTLSAKGTHTLAYWSVDLAGNVEQPRALTLNIGPIDLTASVQLTQQGATLNRATGKYVGGVTITNTSGTTLSGPLQLRLSKLSNGLVLDNATGTDASGAPYITLASALAPGASVTVNLTFSNPNRALVTYTAQLFRGSL